MHRRTNSTVGGARTLLAAAILACAKAAGVGALLLATSAHAEPSSVTIAGDLQSELGCPDDWAPDCATTHLAFQSADGIWKGSFSVPSGTWQYKAALDGSWNENYGQNASFNGENIVLNLGSAGTVKFYYDHATHWVADSVGKRIATVAGSFQSELGCLGDWMPDCLLSWLQDPDGDGVYTFTTTAIPAGSYELKVTINENWTENYGQGGVANGSNLSFNVPADGVQVSFRFVSSTNVPTVQVGSGASHDGSVFWTELGHDSRDALYRGPGGAVATGTPVRLRLRSALNDLTAARVRVWNDRTNIESFLEMSSVAKDANYEWWEATLPASADPTILWYRFIVIDGGDVDYYADDNERTGGWGEATENAVDNAWQVSVASSGFSTPEWVKDAVIYQIFPDRFRDGDGANDTPAGSFFYGGTGAAGTIRRSNQANWNEIICDPRNASSPCPNRYSENFYGGDLQGIIDKLQYLDDLGVTALYLNPVFESPSNHKYDTGDYGRIDDNFGSLATFQDLATQAHARGMHLILDGVFNHTSSDSVYFDFYKRFDADGGPTDVGTDDNSGACESGASPYYSWFYFPHVSNPGGGGLDLCPNGAGDAPQTYEAWFGYGSLPKLKANTAAVRDLVWDHDDNDPLTPSPIAKYWMQWADGWRLDVGGDVDPGVTNDSGNLYWEGFRTAVRAANPDAYIVGEEWGVATAWTLGPEWDATMNYQFSSAVLGFWRDEDFRDNDHAPDSSAGVLTPLSPSALDARLRNLQERYPAEANAAMMNLLGSHDTSRALFMLDHNADLNDASLYQNPAYDWSDAIARLKGVVLLQMTLPGAPTIYYGDEVGLVGPVARAFDKWEDDPYNRQPFPWLDESGSPFYTHLQTQAGQDQLLDHYKLLTSARNSHVALSRGDFRTLKTDDANGIYAYGRKMADGSDAAVIVANRSGFTRDVTLNVSGYLPVGAQFVDALGSANPVVDGPGQLVLTIPARGGALLLLSAAMPSAPDAVDDLAVTAETQEQVDLQWSAAAGATSYDVYRSLLSGGGYQPLGNTVATSFSDSGASVAVRYYYIVVSRNDTTRLAGGASNEVTAQPPFDLGNDSTSWFNLQWPPSITHTISAIDETDTIYARISIDGFTNLHPGQVEGIRAQVGYGPDGTQPDATWQWKEMAYESEQGSDDQYTAALQPEATGSYDYAVRWSGDGGSTWFLADLSGPQRDGALDNPGSLTVTASSDPDPPGAPTDLTVTATSTDSISLAWVDSGFSDEAGFDLYRRVASPLGPWSKVTRTPAGLERRCCWCGAEQVDAACDAREPPAGGLPGV